SRGLCVPGKRILVSPWSQRRETSQARRGREVLKSGAGRFSREFLMPVAVQQIGPALAQGPGSAPAGHPLGGHSLDPVPEKALDGHSAEELGYLRQGYHAGQRIRRNRGCATR